MIWAYDLSRDVAYSLNLSHFQCNLIFTKSTNSAHLFNATLLRSIGLKPTKSASLLLPLNITSFNLVIS